MKTTDKDKSNGFAERRTGTATVLGLFMAAVLTVTTGCGTADTVRSGHAHVDQNNDGYCDEDGERMPGGSGTYGGYHYFGGGYYGPHYGGTAPTKGTTAPSPGASISSGAAGHGGIGGGGSGGGG